jgi:hypothetical protein
MAPVTGPRGPSTVTPVCMTVTSSKTIGGLFSGRQTFPTAGEAPMIMPPGPSRPACQVPSVSSTTPSS